MRKQATPNGHLTYETLDDHIAIVTPNRAEKKNAINPEITQGFDRFIKDSESDPDVWVVILTSSNDPCSAPARTSKKCRRGIRRACTRPRGGRRLRVL
jgi:enoyl-CoA hydratase/carnithine racemase